MSKFSERLRELRETLDLTLDQFAEKLETYKSTISRYENELRIPDVDFVKKVAITFEVSMDWLAGISEVKKLTIMQMSQIPELAEKAKGYIDIAQAAYDSGLSLEDIQQILQIFAKNNKRS